MENIIPNNCVGEQYTDDIALIFKPTEILLSRKTQYQQVDIVNTESYGKILFLDKLLMKAEKDGDIINEMIVHIPMGTGKPKQKVLVVGGGEGFTATHLLNYPELEQIDVIDIDNEFVEIAKQYFPNTTSVFNNPKVKLHIIDGLEYIKNTNTIYDIILVTSTDPAGLSSPLFTQEFYKLCYEKLAEDGIFMTDAYMPYYNLSEIDYKYMLNKVAAYYKISKLYTCTVPTFPGGLFAFVIGSKQYDPENDIRTDVPKIETMYYNSNIHKAAFQLPEFMIKKLSE
jgi:spermidine synthase